MKTYALTKLKAIREARLLTQAELADQVGITNTQLSRLENGAKCRVTTLRKFMDALQCQVVDLAEEAK